MTSTAKTDLREFTKTELIELLTTDIAGWNRLYQEAREASNYLWSADLGSADLRYADLGSADLRYANLRSADLRSASLRYADLRYADLRSASLRSASLRYANLRSADLRSASLRSADLRYADLRSADLRSANLRSANLRWDHPLWAFRADIHAILDAAPGEVETLREKLAAGEVNGSVYEGECACLCGTIANAQHVDVHKIPGVTPNSSRPAEQWFLPISEGDKPVLELLDAADAEWSGEGQYRATVALVWVDEWISSRTMIAAALTNGEVAS